nr:unnamed protein product [Callosobruchus chinensis]
MYFFDVTINVKVYNLTLLHYIRVFSELPDDRSPAVLLLAVTRLPSTPVLSRRRLQEKNNTRRPPCEENDRKNGHSRQNDVHRMGQVREAIQNQAAVDQDTRQEIDKAPPIKQRWSMCCNNILATGKTSDSPFEEQSVVQGQESGPKKDLHINNLHSFLLEPEGGSVGPKLVPGKGQNPTYKSPVGENKSCQSCQKTDSQSRSFGRIVRKNSNKLLRRNSSRRSDIKILQVKPSTGGGTVSSAKCPRTDASDLTSPAFDMDAMERSVDSIGTCSLDVNASADLSNADWSDTTSVVTLRSVSLASTSPSEYHHLPSYLSLACTVNGYSTTTNYDPVRLARSRDASPHRIDSGGVGDLTTAHRPTDRPPTYAVHNNLLSPPNLVPLPPLVAATAPSCLKSGKMENVTTALAHHHGEFYSSKTVTFVSGKETRYSSSVFSHDSVDSCIENGHLTTQNKVVSFETKNITSYNGQTRCTSETALKQEYTNGNETKSFIQQRVERLYGPGALAQGFFVSKRQKSRLSESEDSNRNNNESERHSKSFNDKSMNEEEQEPVIKQSTSTPTLPVLRHLRPEFRAQLPIISPKKPEGHLQKSITVPKLKDEVKVNGHTKSKALDDISCKESTNGHIENNAKEAVKDGHYFLKILNDQTSRLLELADKVEKDILTCELPEEIVGKVRSATGKARLLVSQKMQQFRGLCTNNINQIVGEAFPTTNEDLQGFWDMVMLQVDQIDALFAEIYALRANNWKEPEKEDKSLKNGSLKTKKTAAARPKTTTVNDEARKQREAQRKKMIEERRKAMKAQKNATIGNIEIFVPESS